VLEPLRKNPNRKMAGGPNGTKKKKKKLFLFDKPQMVTPKERKRPFFSKCLNKRNKQQNRMKKYV